MIKSLLVNSRIQIEESIQLDINLALYTSLLRDKIKFIYPRRIQLDESNKIFITYYYLILQFFLFDYFLLYLSNNNLTDVINSTIYKEKWLRKSYK